MLGLAQTHARTHARTHPPSIPPTIYHGQWQHTRLHAAMLFSDGEHALDLQSLSALGNHIRSLFSDGEHAPDPVAPVQTTLAEDRQQVVQVPEADPPACDLARWLCDSTWHTHESPRPNMRCWVNRRDPELYRRDPGTIPVSTWRLTRCGRLKSALSLSRLPTGQSKP